VTGVTWPRQAALPDLDGITKLWWDESIAKRADAPFFRETMERILDRIYVIEEDGRLHGLALELEDTTSLGRKLLMLDPFIAVDRWAERQFALWAREEARDLKVSTTRVWTVDGAGEALRTAGFAHARTFWRMDLDSFEGIATYHAPRGFRITPSAANSVSLTNQVHAYNLGMADEWDFSPETTDSWSRRVNPKRRDPNLDLAVVDELGAVVGLALCRIRSYLGRHNPVGVVEVICIVPEMRSRKIGTALLSEALSRLRSAGALSASLRTDSTNSRSHGLYKNFQFTQTLEFKVWQV
jgi:ribosomal protein S18 acetylase RimI-like enzyme